MHDRLMSNAGFKRSVSSCILLFHPLQCVRWSLPEGASINNTQNSPTTNIYTSTYLLIYTSSTSYWPCAASRVAYVWNSPHLLEQLENAWRCPQRPSGRATYYGGFKAGAWCPPRASRMSAPPAWASPVPHPASVERWTPPPRCPSPTVRATFPRRTDAQLSPVQSPPSRPTTAPPPPWRSSTIVRQMIDGLARSLWTSSQPKHARCSYDRETSYQTCRRQCHCPRPARLSPLCRTRIHIHARIRMCPWPFLSARCCGRQRRASRSHFPCPSHPRTAALRVATALCHHQRRRRR